MGSSSAEEQYNQDDYPHVAYVMKQFGIKFTELLEIINKHDPIEVLSVGAPDSEYNLEVATIIPKLEKTHSEAEVLSLVTSEFERWFGPGQSDYIDLSKDIYKWMQRSNFQLT